MKIKEFIIMPHTADRMGLIHKPGTGPNNRFDFKNKGNNRANELTEKCWDGYKQVGMKNKSGKQVPNCVPEDAAGVGIITKQNTTKDVKPGDEYKNVKKLSLENFADKKIKGKSRPGRVKRAGASCKGSVTSLRSKAKRYSGEKSKMYHWCANMKSGRKKS
jgi:hypothetical protein